MEKQRFRLVELYGQYYLWVLGDKRHCKRYHSTETNSPPINSYAGGFHSLKVLRKALAIK